MAGPGLLYGLWFVSPSSLTALRHKSARKKARISSVLLQPADLWRGRPGQRFRVDCRGRVAELVIRRRDSAGLESLDLPEQLQTGEQYAHLLLGGELLAERCRTDDLMPSISLLCLPPCRVNPEIL